MTLAQIRVLKAVQFGKCQRVYDGAGNKMYGAAPAVLHKLANEGYVKDGQSHGGVVIVCDLVLTDKGREVLRDPAYA